MSSQPQLERDTLPPASGVQRKAVQTEPEPVEPLIPPWAVWIYLLSPPFLSLLLHPELLEQDGSQLVRTLLATWIHTVAAGASLHALYTWVVPRILHPDTQSPALRLAIHTLAILAGLTGGLLVSAPIASLACGWGPRRPWWEAYRALVIASCFVLGMVSYVRLRQHARHIEQRALRAQQAALQARMASLVARTNPHFLFNSLNTVAGLIGEDAERAEEAVVRLADLFRYTLDASRRARVALPRELEAVESYLAMEALRYEERLAYTLSREGPLEQVLVPPLMIQPLVENAIRHGIESRGQGRIEVSARCADNLLTVLVSDDGPGPGRSSHQGSGTSLADLRQRLELVYGDQAKLEVDAREGGGCAVMLQVPAEQA